MVKKVEKEPKEKRIVKIQSYAHSNLVKYHVDEILREVADEIDISDFDSVLRWMLKQPFSKIKFCADKAADLPAIVKAACSSLCADVKYGRNNTLALALDRVLGKAVEVKRVNVSNEQPQLRIEVSSELVENKLSKILELNADDKDVREDS